MNEQPHSDDTPEERRPVRMCAHCDRITATPVLVSEVHAGTGPGFNVYACPDCAPLFPPVPDALSLLPDSNGRAEDDW